MPLLSLPRLVLCLLALAWASPAKLGAAIDAPVSPQAQPNVAQLLQFLESIRGTYILSGQQEIAWSMARKNEDFDYVLKTTGKTPAVRGFDFLQYVYSPSVRAGQDATQRAIAWARVGGIVTFCSHLFMDIGSPAGQPQFYTPGANGNAVGTTFDIRQAVIAGTPENVEFLAKLDIMAEELKKLRDAGVVVIWRPFHESSGTWFWWGSKGAAPFKEAWRIMFQRYTGLHALNNLIWCFNPTDPATNLASWYPGDDMVDMISLDVYPPAGTHPTFAADYNRLRDFTAGRKVVAMSENGAIPHIDQLFSDNAHWTYFCTWNGFENDPAQNTANFLTTVYNHPKVITLDELPSLYVADAWAITTQPKTQLVRVGSTVSLSVAANGPGPLLYQWYKAGVAIPGATQSSHALSPVMTDSAGSYDMVVTSTAGTLRSSTAVITVANTDAGGLANLSVLATAGTADQTLIVGFVMTGSATPKNLLLRGMGPALGPLGVSGFLADPRLQLNTTTPVINDDWGSNVSTSVPDFTAAFVRLGVQPRPAATSKDAALLTALAGGAYTASVTGIGGTTGTALAEIYDAAQSEGARLVNIAARSQVSGGSVLVAGFVITGDARTVLIRAVGGQALTERGVSGALANPKFDLYESANGTSTVIASNDEWSTGDTAISTLRDTFTYVGAFPLNASSHDAVILITLRPGVYSARVNSADDTAGVALIEIYEVR